MKKQRRIEMTGMISVLVPDQQGSSFCQQLCEKITGNNDMVRLNEKSFVYRVTKG